MCATTNGSMTQGTFFEYCKHFVRNLPEDQGKGKKPVFLFLDGHSSRYSIEAGAYLLENNVIGVIIPSHTSSWAQLNDCGPNKLLKEIIRQQIARFRSQRKTRLTSYSFEVVNLVLSNAYLEFMEVCDKDLLNTCQNVITKAARDIGLYPFNSNNRNWNAALTR